MQNKEKSKIKLALYFNALSKLKAQVSDLDLKEMIIVSNPSSVHAETGELAKIILEKSQLKLAIDYASEETFKASKNIPSAVTPGEGKTDAKAT